MSNIAELAGRLSKAQIDVLCSAQPDEWHPHRYWTALWIASGGSVAQSLCMKGLMERQFFLRPAKRHARYRLTPLGQQVRAHLLT